MQTRTITPPTTQPISVENFKNFINLDHDEDDQKILELIQGVTKEAERYTGRNFMNRVVEQTVENIGITYDDDAWFEQEDIGIEVVRIQPFIVLSQTPFVSIESIEYYTSTSETANVWDSGEYVVRSARDFAKIQPVRNGRWPEGLRNQDAMRIRYTTGFGDNPNDVPEDIRNAIKMQVKHEYLEEAGSRSVRAYEIFKANQVYTGIL